MFVPAKNDDVIFCPEALAACPNKVLLECEEEAATAVLKDPKAVNGVVLEEFTAEELPNPENPEVPKPLVVSKVLNEKEAADGAVGLPKPTEWDMLGEDVMPAEELPKAGEFPDDPLPRPVLVLKEKVLALLLLLLTGKPAVIKCIKKCYHVHTWAINHCCILIMQSSKIQENVKWFLMQELT